MEGNYSEEKLDFFYHKVHIFECSQVLMFYQLNALLPLID